MTTPLPHGDQPTRYTGTHGRVTIQHINLERTPGAALTAHLCPPNHAGTYCGRYNPRHVYGLEGMTYTLPSTARRTIPPTGATLPHLLAGVKHWTIQGEGMAVCLHCASMLACEAEMIGHNAYRVRGTLARMSKLEPPTGFTPPR